LKSKDDLRKDDLDRSSLCEAFWVSCNAELTVKSYCSRRRIRDHKNTRAQREHRSTGKDFRS